ncbi:universal stress protein [Crocinitomix catalasitica]|uniref:universal stress protein n=1 Tax=Crocinitomix catalasitica TaxID=184607 RepID=UPI000488BFB8|nr:universal stress protein [Crocinitomix catalasitica]
MKKILFPTNFTELSFNAFTYALEYAKKSKAKLIVYHAYNPLTSKVEAQKFYDKIDIENFINKKDKFQPFENIKLAQQAKEVEIKYVVNEGDFLENIKKYIAKREDKIDLVIMGTQSMQNGLFEIFMETKTLSILEDINKPVLAIPEKAIFDGLMNNIVFLVDYREDEKKALEDILVQAKFFKAKLHVLHIDLAHGESITPLMENFKNSIELSHYDNVEFVSIDSIDIKETLQSYCLNNKIDMVCLINHRRNFYQRFFSYSLTQELLSHFSIPIMAIYVD